jgi:hypothetical protein
MRRSVGSSVKISRMNGGHRQTGWFTATRSKTTKITPENGPIEILADLTYRPRARGCAGSSARRPRKTHTRAVRQKQKSAVSIHSKPQRAILVDKKKKKKNPPLSKNYTHNKHDGEGDPAAGEDACFELSNNRFSRRGRHRRGRIHVCKSHLMHHQGRRRVHEWGCESGAHRPGPWRRARVQQGTSPF